MPSPSTFSRICHSAIFPLLFCFSASFFFGCAVSERASYNRATGSYEIPSAKASEKNPPREQAENELQENADEDDSNNQMGPFETAAKPWMGTPYLLGGTSKKGVDCSGFVINIYRDVRGISLPRTASQMFKTGKKVSRGNLTEGDLVFFGRFWKIDHVGIYLEGGRFVHASTSRGVMISPMNDSYWTKRYQGARRP